MDVYSLLNFCVQTNTENVALFTSKKKENTLGKCLTVFKSGQEKASVGTHMDQQSF